MSRGLASGPLPSLSAHDLLSIVADVCTATFGVAAATGEPPDTDTLTAWASTTITTDGGSLDVAAGMDAATERRLASVMFSTGVPTAAHRDAAIRELANIIGGNVKGALGVPAELSPPRREAAGSSTISTRCDPLVAAALSAAATDGSAPVNLVVIVHPRAAGTR